MSVVFCKYLHNQSSNLYEILCGGQLLSCELKFQISQRSVKNARARVVKARTRDKTCARLYEVREDILPFIMNTKL